MMAGMNSHGNRFRSAPCACIVFALLGHAIEPAVGRADAGHFDERVRPLLVNYCQECHSGGKPKGDFHFDRLTGDFAGCHVYIDPPGFALESFDVIRGWREHYWLTGWRKGAVEVTVDGRKMPYLHGQHLAFDPANPPPLANLYVSMLQRLGIETEKFASSTGSLAGLDVRS